LSIVSYNPVARVVTRLRGKLRQRKPGSRLRCLGYTVRINDAANFYVLRKDIFVRRIYHFEARRPDPLILDCGSNIGMSILYFKRTYPKSRIIGFEPDPSIFPYLKENVERAGLRDVTLVQGAITSHGGSLTMYSDGKYGSCLAKYGGDGPPAGWKEYNVPCVHLRDYLTEPVDLLKLNIEGAEWDALAGSEDHLRQVRELVIEYHHLPGLPRTLHKILELLHRCGFDYLINDFDAETNPGSQPPFHLGAESRYFLLIYAKRLD
jgi:FkbM family methyltransferase